MAGDNEAVQPVKGDVRRYIEGGYKPVGATSGQVLTQGPDYDGMNRGFWMGLDAFNSRGRSGGSGKQDYSGQYQVEMEDWASNPEYHNANGTPNAKGLEAARSIRVKYAPYLSGGEIRATDQSVGSGYKESVDNALRTSFIQQQASDYAAQNKAALDILDKSHPEYSQLPLQQRIQLGNEQIRRVNASIALQNTIKNSDDPQVINSAIKSISDNLIQDLSEETIMKIRTTGITTQDRQQLVDLWASIGVQNFGWTPQEAQVNAIKIADGAMGHLREYQKDLIAQTEDEIKFTVNDAKLKMLTSAPKLLAYYAATNGQVPPDVLANLITGNISFGSAYRTVENKDGTYSRQLIVTDKNIRNLGLNYGNEATASASLASAIPEIDAALRAGNGTPLLGLRNLPALGGIMQAKNKDEKFLRAKQQLANDFSIELANNARHYYKGGNEIDENVAKQISDVINTASYLGYTNEECKDIVNNALLSLGMKPVKGAHTPEELDNSIKGAFNRLARGEVLGFKLFGEAQGSQQEEQSNDLGIDVTQYMNENNQITQAPSNTEQPQVVNDEANQMSRINVYETPEYQEFRSKIVNDVRSGRMTPAQAQNEGNQFLSRAKEALARVASEFGVKSARAETAEGVAGYNNLIKQYENQQPAYLDGNIDLNHRKVVINKDGSFSTENSITISEDGQDVLIPTIVDGKQLSDDKAIEHYQKTGEFLKKGTPEEVEDYAVKLHQRQESFYAPLAEARGAKVKSTNVENKQITKVQKSGVVKKTNNNKRSNFPLRSFSTGNSDPREQRGKDVNIEVIELDDGSYALVDGHHGKEYAKKRFEQSGLHYGIFDTKDIAETGKRRIMENLYRYYHGLPSVELEYELNK